MHPLFTSSSKFVLPLRELAITFLLVISATIVSDQLLEYVFDTVFHVAPAITANTESRSGLDSFWHLSDAGKLPIVVSGSSMMLKAFSPYEFDAQIAANSDLSVVSVNVSYSGSRPVMMREYIKYSILPEHPQLFLYGIEPRALNSPEPNTYPSGTASYLSSPVGYAVTQPSEPIRTASLWLVRYSGFIRYREIIKSWLESGRFNIDSAPDDRGFQPLTGMLKGRENLYADAVAFPEINPVQHKAIKEIANDCHEVAVSCIFVSMPMSAESYKYFLPQDAQKFQEELQHITQETGLPTWNFNTPQCRALLDSTLFYDLSHLNKAGAQKFSAMLATLYLEQIKQRSVQPESGTDCVQILKP